MFYVLCFICSLLLTFGLLKYAKIKNVIDIPNERSSHTVPTPRGGGLSIVITFIIAISLFLYFEKIDVVLGCAILLSSSVVALIGFIDDHGHIHAKWRLLVHFLSALGLVLVLGGLPMINIFGITIDFSYVGIALAVIAMIWILNLFNFMDGIDGIAGVEAVFVTFFAGLFLYLVLPESPIVELLWFLSAACVGFLVLNFPPAKIFMGDAGSGFLGFILAALALTSSHEVKEMLWVWLVLLGVFIVDATFTVIRRFINKEKVHEAHRSHAYQYASRIHKSHLKVTLGVVFINLCWLAPIAYLISQQYVDGFVGLCLAYLPLILLAIHYKAGQKEIIAS